MDWENCPQPRRVVLGLKGLSSFKNTAYYTLLHVPKYSQGTMLQPITVYY